MRLRHQLPVFSPLPARAVLAGVAGLVSPPAGALGAIEARIQARFAARRVLLVDSGTSALALALRAAAAAQRGRPVALPAWGCYDLATAADAADVKVVLYDLDPATLGPDWASLRAALSAGIAAVVIAHYYGVPVDLPAVSALCAEAGVLLIEDAAQGAGGMLGGVPLGALGPVSVLSFGRGKGLTGGAGGALLATRPEGELVLVAAAPRVAAAGSALKATVALAAQWLLGRPALYGVPASLPWLQLGQTLYHPAHPASALPAAAAAVLDRVWDTAHAAAEGRRRRAAAWHSVLPAGWTPIVPPAGSAAGWLRFPVLAPSADAPVLDARARTLGIAPGYPKALVDLEGFVARATNPGGPFSGSRTLAARLVTLPTHERVSDADVVQTQQWMTSRPG